MSDLQMTTSLEGGFHRLKLAGEATIYHALPLKAQVLEALGNSLPVELDLEGVVEIDTAGLQVLVLLGRECRQRDRNLRLLKLSHSVQQLIDLYGLSSYFEMPSDSSSEAA